jgi:hypothetical protein
MRDDDSDRRRALPRHQAEPRREALNVFYDIREVPGLKKKPSTSELLDWLKLLMVEDIDAGNAAREKDPNKLIPPLHGALLKNEQDVHLFERLAFMARRVGGDGGNEVQDFYYLVARGAGEGREASRPVRQGVRHRLQGTRQLLRRGRRPPVPGGVAEASCPRNSSPKKRRSRSRPWAAGTSSWRR